MRLSITQMQALPLIALGTGLFILAATIDAPAEGERAGRFGPEIVVEAAAPDATLAAAERKEEPQGITLAHQ
jgi:hypothetical protein